MKKYIIYISLIFTVLFSCKQPPTDAPAIISGISGVVKSQSNGSILKDVLITTSPSTKSVNTDNNGYYEIKDISPAPYTVYASKTGYNPSNINVTVIEGKIVQGDIQLREEGPELNVNPLSIDFGATQTSSSIVLTNVGIGTLNFTIAKNASWLTLSENSGSITTNPKSITITVDRGSVGYGTYTDVVQVTSNGGNKSVNISMDKRDPNAPYLVVSPFQLNFGTTSNSLNLNISNGGAGNLIWSTTKDQNWIQINPSSGTNSGTIVVTVDRSGLPNGQNFAGNITLNSNGGNKIIPVTMSTGTPYTGTWSVMTSNLPGINSTSNSSMYCLSSTNIWVVGDKIWNWNGSQWTEKQKPTNIGTLHSISMVTQNVGYALAEYIGSNNGGVIKYDGNNWTSLSSSPPGGSAITILSENDINVYYRNYVYKSTNGGNNWSSEDVSSIIGISNPFYLFVNASSIISPSNAFAVYSYDFGGYTGGGSAILKNNGIGWNLIYNNQESYDLIGITVVDQNTFWVSLGNNSGGYSKIIKYNNGLFNSEFTSQNSYIQCISMTNSNYGWAGGANLYQYINSSWTKKVSNVSGNVVCIKMLSETEGYAVTGNGAILKYQ